MGKVSSIEWLKGGHTGSPWHGCSHGIYTDADGNEHEHPGCAHCYAEKNAKRNPGTLGVWGTGGTRVRSVSFANNCRRWNKAAEKAGVAQSVFPSVCDPFEQWDGPIHGTGGVVTMRCDNCGERSLSEDNCNCMCGRKMREQTMDDLRRDLFEVIDSCPWLNFYLLTKRPQNIRRMWPACMGAEDDIARGGDGQTFSYYRPNVWLLTSVSEQETADAMIPHLLKCRDLVPVLGISAEPLLGSVNFRSIKIPAVQKDSPLQPINQVREIDALTGEQFTPLGSGALVYSGPRLDWVIVGCESGHGRRPMEREWAERIADQCHAAGVKMFMKQMEVDGKVTGETEEFPERLQVREWPVVGRRHGGGGHKHSAGFEGSIWLS